MRVIVDVDCVVADLVKALLDVTGKTDRSAANEYDWFEQYDKDDRLKTRRAMSSPNFWKTLPLIDGAKEGIEFLRENKHEILWVRAPYWKCFGWADVRREWLETNFEMLSRKEAFFPTEDKHLVGALSIIDDRADIVKKHQLHNPDSIGYIFRSELNLHSGEQLVDWKKIMTMEFFHYEKPNY